MGDFEAVRPLERDEPLVLSLDREGDEERDAERDRWGGSYGRNVRYSTEMISWYPYFKLRQLPLQYQSYRSTDLKIAEGFPFPQNRYDHLVQLLL